MKQIYSLRELVIWMMMVALILGVVASRLEVTSLINQRTQLQNQLRTQLNTEEYSISGAVIAQTKNFLIYSVHTEANFMHSLQLRDLTKDKRQESELKGYSHVNADRNVWTCFIVLIVAVEEKAIRYYVSTKPHVSDAFAEEIASENGILPKIQGFGESGKYLEPFPIPLANGTDLPIQIDFMRETSFDGPTNGLIP